MPSFVTFIHLHDILVSGARGLGEPPPCIAEAAQVHVAYCGIHISVSQTPATAMATSLATTSGVLDTEVTCRAWLPH